MAGQYVDLLREYNERREEGARRFKVKYKEIRASRESYKQFMPEEMEDVSSSSIFDYGSTDDDDYDIPANTSRYLYPIHKAISKKMIEDLTSNMPRYEVESNDEKGSIAKKHMEKEFRKVYAKENIRLKQNQAYFHAIEGTIFSQTTTKELVEKIIMPSGEPKTIPQGRTMDIIVYDPLTVIPDYNANPSDPMETAQWIIVTIGTFSPEYLKKEYGYDKPAGNSNGNMNDQWKQQAKDDSGFDAQGLLPVTEYYMVDGWRYTIVNHEFVARKERNENGIYGRIPINICQTNFDPDNVFGVPIYKDIQPSVEMMSAAINQICDNTARNNNAPVIVPKNCGLDHMSLNDMNPNEIVGIDLLAAGVAGAGKGFDVNRMVTKLQFNEVTQGAMFQFQEAQKAIFYVMGINPADFGIQEKQIRTNDVAGLIGEASTKSSSDFIMRLEAGHINPTTADMQRIMGIYFEDFNFPEGITQDMILDMKSLRVVSGSYLPADRMTKLGKLQVLFQRAVQNPTIYKNFELEQSLIETLGVGTPSEWLKTPEQIQDEMNAKVEMNKQAMAGQPVGSEVQ